MNDIVIEARNLAKQYRLGVRAPLGTLGESIASAAGSTFRALRRRSAGRARAAGGDTLWALRDVSFDVRRGEVVGVIGRNGAGKSTLLKILSRITMPSVGHVYLEGRVGSLLEVGTGFHPELTGRENIFLNGAILGMGRAEVRRKLGAIVEFAGVERFVDTPVKRYSSGMYVRLAFAVAAHLTSDILVIDEVLAVGDAEFQAKCVGRMGDIARNGRTVLFVSHNLGAVKNLCSRAILLEHGAVRHAGSTDDVIASYMTEHLSRSGSWRRTDPLPEARGIYFEGVQLRNREGLITARLNHNDVCRIQVTFVASARFTDAEIAIRWTNQDGVPVFTTANGDAHGAFVPIEPGRHTYEVTIPCEILRPGTYALAFAALVPTVELLDAINEELAVLVEDTGSHATATRDQRLGVLTPVFEWKRAEAEPLRRHAADVPPQGPTV